MNICSYLNKSMWTVLPVMWFKFIFYFDMTKVRSLPRGHQRASDVM